jgi:hypothetical protein
MRLSAACEPTSEPCRENPPSGCWDPSLVSTMAVQSEGRALHTLIEGFSVFGVHVQYWMLIAALIVTIAVVSGLRK